MGLPALKRLPDAMIDEQQLRQSLASLPLGEIRFFRSVGSTNDEALVLAASGAPDLSLVYAEEQTAGRGRGGRRWFTPAGAALAFSLVLRPSPGPEPPAPFFSAVGALAVCETLRAHGLDAQIKWPNDVLLRRRKVCGILGEAIWAGHRLESVVLGIGVNIREAAVPPAESLNFPATSVDAEAGKRTDRLALLAEILAALIYWRGQMMMPLFLQTWEQRLAFRGEEVEISMDTGERCSGVLDGLTREGSLRLRTAQGQTFTVHFGEVHVRPLL